MHCRLYGGVVGVNSTDNCGFKRCFRDVAGDCGSAPQSLKRLKVVPSSNSTTFIDQDVVSSVKRTSGAIQFLGSLCRPGDSSNQIATSEPLQRKNRDILQGEAGTRGEYLCKAHASTGQQCYEGDKLHTFRWAEYFKPFGVLAYVFKEPREQLKKLEEKYAKGIIWAFLPPIAVGSLASGRNMKELSKVKNFL